MEARGKNLKQTIMAFKMKGAPLHDLSSKHGTNANYKKSGAPGLLGKILDPLGLKKKLMGGGKDNCPPAQAAQAQVGAAKPAEPVTPAAPAAAAPAAPEEAAAPTMMKKGLKNGAPMAQRPPKGRKPIKPTPMPRPKPKKKTAKDFDKIIGKKKMGAPMKKSPMEKGKTSTLDKLKAAGKAFIAGAKETHGGAKAAMDTYAMEKRKYREAAEKNKKK